MKILKYLGITILIIIGLTAGPTLAMAFGTCAFLGFIIIGGLDAIGIVKIPIRDNFNVITGISFIIGFIIFLIYYSITGWPEI